MHNLFIEVGTELKRAVLIMASPLQPRRPGSPLSPCRKTPLDANAPSLLAYISKLQVIRGPSRQIFFYGGVLTIGCSFTLVGSAFEGRKLKTISRGIRRSVEICKGKCLYMQIYADGELRTGCFAMDIKWSWKNGRGLRGQIYKGWLNLEA